MGEYGLRRKPNEWNGQGNDMSTQATKRQPVRRYYALAAILMIVGIAKFPFGQGASIDPNALVVSIALIAISVACVIRGRRNKRGE